jgi:mono/diheme cytochrome c family protein
VLQRTLLKFRKSKPRTCCLSFETGLMKRKLPVLALLLTLGLTAKDRVQAKAGSAGSSASGGTVRSGATHYERFCSGCHGSDGLALAGEAPPLAGSSWVSGPEARLIKIALHGLRGPIQVGGKMYDREMPGIGRRLSDREMAALLSFVRNRWGASSAAITPAAVTRVRTEARNRQRYWTVEELVAVP